MGEMKNAYRISVGKSEGKHHLEGLVVDGKTVILKLILNVGYETRFNSCISEQGLVAGSCEHGNGLLGKEAAGDWTSQLQLLV
jgi:hypothetical protein